MTAHRPETVGGLAIICALLTGFLGLIVTVFAVIASNWTGAGVCLISAALAFGLVANAVWRH